MPPGAKAVASHWADVLNSALGWQVASVKERRFSSLWAGYGYVSSLSVSLPAARAPLASNVPLQVSRLIDAAYEHSEAPILSLVVKQVAPPSGAGVSHDRKIRSYEVEAEFYRRHVPLMLQRQSQEGSCAAPGPQLPVPLFVSLQPPHSFTFVLSDLRQQFPVSPGDMGMDQLKTALTWLAQMHAHFWEVPPEQLAGLWPQGSYWHLQTRQEELDRMGPEWQDLKAVAQQLDALLRGKQPDGSFSSRHMTVCHGDYKSANILFRKDGSSCAAFDFQYVGQSLGVRDIAYLLCSSADDSVLEQAGSEEELLQHYHSQLLTCLSQRSASSDSCRSSSPAPSQGPLRLGEGYTIDVLRTHYEWALLDFVRFMAGWGMWGAAGWGERRARELLAKGIQGG